MSSTTSNAPSVAPTTTSSAGTAGTAGELTAQQSFVCFNIAGRNYGLDVAVIREVVTIERLLPVPKAPAAIKGAFALRGATVALVDTRTIFGIPAADTYSQALILARSHRVICGITIDTVLGVIAFEPKLFSPATRGQDPPQVAGFLTNESAGLVTLLDTANVMRTIERLRF